MVKWPPSPSSVPHLHWVFNLFPLQDQHQHQPGYLPASPHYSLCTHQPEDPGKLAQVVASRLTWLSAFNGSPTPLSIKARVRLGARWLHLPTAPSSLGSSCCSSVLTNTFPFHLLFPCSRSPRCPHSELLPFPYRTSIQMSPPQRSTTRYSLYTASSQHALSPVLLLSS